MSLIALISVTQEDIDTKRKRKRRSQADTFLETVETSHPKETLGRQLIAPFFSFSYAPLRSTYRCAISSATLEG